jgi:hypothetical protein
MRLLINAQFAPGAWSGRVGQFSMGLVDRLGRVADGEE